MAGGNFLGRVISYVVNEVVVEALANNQSFQRFAVRTSKAIREASTKLGDAKEGMAEQMKDISKNFDASKGR